MKLLILILHGNLQVPPLPELQVRSTLLPVWCAVTAFYLFSYWSNARTMRASKGKNTQSRNPGNTVRHLRVEHMTII